MMILASKCNVHNVELPQNKITRGGAPGIPGGFDSACLPGGGENIRIWHFLTSPGWGQNALVQSGIQIEKNGKKYQPVDMMNLLLKVSDLFRATSLFPIWLSCDQGIPHVIFNDVQAVEAKSPGYEVDILVEIKFC